MDGYQVARLEDVIGEADIFITATGCFDVITADDMQKMKHQAIVGNIGHFDNEIDMAGLLLCRASRARRSSHRLTSGPSPMAAASSCCPRVVAEPRERHRTPVVRDEQLVLRTRCSPRSNCSPSVTSTRSVCTPPKHLDEKVARLHLDALGVRLTELNKQQAEYLGVDVAGPYKPDHYRY